MKREDGAAETAAGVACTVTIGGRTIEFVLDGPLVAMAPASEKAEKRPIKRGRK